MQRLKFEAKDIPTQMLPELTSIAVTYADSIEKGTTIIQVLLAFANELASNQLREVKNIAGIFRIAEHCMISELDKLKGNVETEPKKAGREGYKKELAAITPEDKEKDFTGVPYDQILASK